jgi:MFS family permease
VTGAQAIPVKATRAQRLERLGVPRFAQPGSSVLIAALLIQSIGNGLFYSFVLIYFHKVAGLPLAQVGLAVTIASGIGLFANPIAGQIVDRVGAKQMVSLSQAIQAVGYASFFIADSIPMVVVVMMITMFGERIYWVAFPTLVSNISAPGERDRWFAFTTAVRNAGLGLGGAISGAVIWLAGNDGYRILLGANVVGYTVASSLLILRVPRIGEGVRSADHGGYKQVLRDRPAMTVTGANVIFAYCAMLIYFGLPVYVVETLDLPAWVVGLLFALNTAQLALGQTLAIRAVEAWRRTRILAAAGLIWVVTAGLFAFALALPRSVLLPYIILVLMIYTFGELIHAPTSTSLVASLAPDALRGRYISMISLSWGIAQTVGPALFTGLLTVNGVLPWSVTALFALGSVALVLWAEPAIPRGILRPETRS